MLKPTLYLNTQGHLTVDLTEPTINKYLQLLLYRENDRTLVDQDYYTRDHNLHYQVEDNGHWGHYSACLYVPADYNTTTPYTLLATFQPD